MRARKALRDIGEVRFEQSGQTHQNEERASDDSCGLQGQMVDHARSLLAAREVDRTGVPYKLNPFACWIRTSKISPASLSSPSNTTILFVRVRPIRRAGFVLLRPSQRTSRSRPTNRSPARRADSSTTRSKS